MNLLKNLILMSTLSVGISHAGTVPCNGFKIDFRNATHQNLVIDGVSLIGGSLSTTDPTIMEVNKHSLYTVNQSVEGGVMMGEFLFHTTTEPHKELKLNFNLTNKNMVCEVSDVSKQGNLVTNPHRVLGGLTVPIKD